MRVDFANDDEKDTHEDAIQMKEDSLAPDAASMAIDHVGDHTTKRSTNDVQKSEHGRPVTVLLKREFREVFVVVIAQDAVDRQLRAETAEVACRCHKGLESQNDICSFSESWLLDDLAFGSFDHLLDWYVGFIIGIVVRFLFLLFVNVGTRH